MVLFSMSAFHVPFRRGLPLGLATARKRTAGGANSGRLGHAVRHPSNDDLGGTKRPPEGSGDVERERERESWGHVQPRRRNY